MDTIVAALTEQQDELSSLLADLNEDDWQRPSRCDGWTVSDVVLHLAQTNELATGSAEGRFAEVVTGLTEGIGPAADVDESADQMVIRERGAPGAVVSERWQSSVRAMRAALAACDPHQRVEWVAGQLSVQTLATTRLAETWIHTGDVAAAFGPLPAPTERLRPICRLAWRTLPYAFARAGRSLTGPVAFELDAPDGGAWSFVPDDEPATRVQGAAIDLCLVAARRADPATTSLQAVGPDAEAVLELVRTFA